MSGFRALRFRRTIVLPLALGGWLTGCTVWRVSEDPLRQVVADEAPDRLRVTLRSDEIVEIREPMIRGDTLYGRRDADAGGDDRFAAATEDVLRVELREVSAGRSVFLIGALAVVVGSALAAQTWDSSWGCHGEQGCASCPLVYSWDGQAWRLDSGTFGGAIARPLVRTDLDNLDHARPVEGSLRLRLANELDETEYVDAFSVLVAEHASGVTVSPDGYGGLHALADPRSPASARDERGESVLSEVYWADGWSWESALSRRDTSVAEELSDGIELTFPRPDGEIEARLVLDGNSSPWAAFLMTEYVRMHGRETSGWYDSLNNDPARARAFGQKLAEEAFLKASVLTDSGWEPQGSFWEAGPEVIKRQVMPLDLSRVSGDTVHVRLESIPSFWLIDRVAIDYGPEPGFVVREVFPETAFDERGVDVAPLLRSPDGREWRMEKGDRAEIQVPVPPVRDGVARTYLLRTRGWYRIHGPDEGEPARELLRRIEAEAGSIARIAVGRANDAFGALAARRGSPSTASDAVAGSR